jgi:hypothetical protein
VKTCARCWHIIGEHYCCSDHGGESGFTAPAYKLKAKTIDVPPEPINIHDSWFDFLNIGQKVVSEVTP